MMPNDAGKNEGGERLIHIATIIAAHGIKGEVKIQSFCEEPTALADYGPLQDEAGATYAIRVRAATGPVLVASLKGVADRSAAERLAKEEAEKKAEMEHKNRMAEADQRLCDIVAKAAAKIAATENSQALNSGLYDEFISKAGEDRGK